MGGADVHLIIVKETGLDPRTTQKYSEFLKDQGVLKKGRGQEWIIDTLRINDLLADETTDNDSHSPN